MQGRNPDDAAGVRREYVEGPYGQVHVRRSTGRADASRNPLVCLHLTPGSGRMYERLLAELGRERLCLAPDTPGYGASDPPPDPPTIGDYAAVVGHLLDHYGLDSVDVMGYHTGSKIAVELALTRPTQVRRLVLVSAPDYTDAEEERQRSALAVPPEPRDDGGHLRDHWRGLLAWRPPGTPLTLVQRELSEQLRAGERAHWGYRAAFAYQHRDHLPGVVQPVLLLCPQDDLEQPTLRAERLLRNGSMVRLPGFGHGMLDTRTAEVADVVRAHLDGAPDVPGPGAESRQPT